MPLEQMKYKEGERVIYKAEINSDSTCIGTIQKVITAGESLRPEPVIQKKSLPRYVTQSISSYFIFYSVRLLKTKMSILMKLLLKSTL